MVIRATLTTKGLYRVPVSLQAVKFSQFPSLRLKDGRVDGMEGAAPGLEWQHDLTKRALPEDGDHITS